MSRPSQERLTRQLQMEHSSTKNTVGNQTTGGDTSFHTVHAAGSKILEDLVAKIQKEEGGYALQDADFA